MKQSYSNSGKLLRQPGMITKILSMCPLCRSNSNVSVEPMKSVFLETAFLILMIGVSDMNEWS